jgi:hypothetical protein
MTFHNFKLIRTKKGSQFIAGPSYCEEDEMGKKAYKPYIEFTKQKSEEFTKAVMEELKPFLGTNDKSF